MANTQIRGLQIKDTFFGAGLLRNLSNGDIADVNVDDVSIEVNGSNALQVIDGSITNAKLDGLARGFIKRGSATGTVEDLDANNDGYILIGDGTDVNSVAVSGDVTIDNLGATAIGADKVTKLMINADVAGVGLSQAVGGELDVNVDDDTIGINGSDQVYVKVNSIGANEIDETDNYSFSGTFQVSTAPISGNDVTNKTYVDDLVNGLQWKDPVKLKSTVSDGNIVLSGVSGQSLDSIALTADDRVLLTEQTNKIENGIWVVKSGSWVRPTDFPIGGEAVNATVLVSEGTDFADTQHTCTTNSDVDVIDTNVLDFTQISGTGSITAGSGLSKSGNTLNVNVDDSTTEINGSDQVVVKDAGITNAKLDGLARGFIKRGSATGTVEDLDANNDGYILIGDGTDVNSVAVSGDVTIDNLGATAIGADKVTKLMINADVAGVGILQNVDGSLEINVDNSSIEIASGETLQVKSGGITDVMLAVDYIKVSEVGTDTMEFVTNVLNVKDLGIDTAQLANLAVTNAKIADDTIAEVKLDVFNAPTNGKVLGYTANGLEWVSGTDDAVVEGDIQKENESVNCNGATTVFTLSNTPVDASVQVYLNGLLQEEGSGKDYTHSGTSITFVDAPLTGDILLVHYIINN